MRWADRCRAIAALVLGIAGTLHAAPANQSTYGKVETFDPGKKYNCVPSADHKSWDCAQIGNVTRSDAALAAHHDEPAPTAHPNPRSAATAAPPVPPPVQTAPRTGTLPSYLLAPGASSQAEPAPLAGTGPVAAPTPVATPTPTVAPKPPSAPVVHTSTNPPPAAAVAASPPAPKAAPPPEPMAAAATVAKPASSASAVAAPAPASALAHSGAPASDSTRNSADFLALPGDQYVIELAHGKRETDIAATRSALHLSHGEAYELHLRQNGSDAWLLVWGIFNDVGTARAARGELRTDAHSSWPRRIAPLQAELRRAQE